MRANNAIRNVVLLALCQASGTTGNIIVFSVSALAAMELVTDQSLVTIPLFLQYLVATLATVPASFLMKRLGRRAGFILGSAIACVGGGVAFAALRAGSLVLFCVGSALIGVLVGFIPYYRFAAVDAAGEEFKNRALSLVLAGGVLAALVAPTLAALSKDAFETEYAGNFLMLVLLPVFSIGLLSFVRIAPAEDHEQQGARALFTLLKQPKFLLALSGGVISYGVMSILMVATPISMKHSALPFANITLVIQWHVLGMFAPSFVTGNLIQRFGVYKVLIAGGICNLCCIAINLSGITLYHYFIALFLLGVGWNFLFIGSSSLLTECYNQSEKALVQAVNEFSILLTMSVSSLTSGVLMDLFGWKTINLIALPQVLLVLAASTWLLSRKDDLRPAET